MKVNVNNALINVLVSFCLLFLLGGNALADIGLSDFTSSNSDPVNGLGEAKPMMLEVVSIVIGLFLVTCVIGVFASGSTANVGNILHNVSVRSKGILGIVTVLGVIFAVIVTLVLFFHMYNKYLA